MPIFHLGPKHSRLVWRVRNGKLVTCYVICTQNYCSFSYVGQDEVSGPTCQIWHGTFSFYGDHDLWVRCGSCSPTLLFHQTSLHGLNTNGELFPHSFPSCFRTPEIRHVGRPRFLWITTYYVISMEFPEHFRPKKQLYMLEHCCMCCPNSALAKPFCTVT